MGKFTLFRYIGLILLLWAGLWFASCSDPQSSDGKESVIIDIDGDGIANGEDPDVDGDGIANGEDDDVDGDGKLNGEDTDVDGDGLLNGEDPDVDGDGKLNGVDSDVDGDGIANGDDPDVDGDAIANGDDLDVDGDGLTNGEDSDVDGDGIANADDPDVDGDGLLNADDPDIDGDTIANADDTDNNGSTIEPVVPVVETKVIFEGDLDGDSIPNETDPDMDGDGLPNALDPDIDDDGYLNADDPFLGEIPLKEIVVITDTMETPEVGTSIVESGTIDRVNQYGIEQCFSGDPGGDLSGTDVPLVKFLHAVNDTVVDIVVIFSPHFVDNTYGDNHIGWSRNRKHTFNDLRGSDHVALTLVDSNNAVVFDLQLDYIEETDKVSSGYASLGPFDGDGKLTTGNAEDIIFFGTSLDYNINYYGYELFENSPETDSVYSANPDYPNWEFHVIYYISVRAEAFGESGFGGANMESVHASPAKTANETITVTQSDCPEEGSTIDVFRNSLIYTNPPCDNDDGTPCYPTHYPPPCDSDDGKLCYPDPPCDPDDGDICGDTTTVTDPPCDPDNGDVCNDTPVTDPPCDSDNGEVCNDPPVTEPCDTDNGEVCP